MGFQKKNQQIGSITWRGTKFTKTLWHFLCNIAYTNGTLSR